jgi:hypothetical protein
MSLRFDPELPYRNHHLIGIIIMTNHMPPIPPANRSKKGTGGDPQSLGNAPVEHPERQNIAEQGETANIKQNTTNKGYFHGRRMK